MYNKIGITYYKHQRAEIAAGPTAAHYWHGEQENTNDN